MLRFIVSAAALALASLASAQPLTTAFTFQGLLKNGAAPATGTYDFKFALFDAPTAGTQLGSQLCADNVAVSGGTFTTQLDFGSQFAGQQRFLEVWVRPDTGLTCASNANFVILAPRQNLTAAPNAVFALNAGAAATAASATNATNLNSQPASFYTNATNLSTGTIPDARLSTNAALLTGTQSFSGAKSFSAPASFTIATGTAPFSVTSTTRITNLNADLLDGLDSTAFSLSTHTHDASAITTGLLADARLSTNIPRLNAGNTFTTGQTISMSTQTPLNMTSSSTGGTWMNLGNTSAGGHTWNAIATASGNSEGVGKLLFRDQTANAVRMTLDTIGRVGIGTTAPSSTLEIDEQDPQLRLRNVNDTGGGTLLDTFSSLQLGMFNPSAAAWGAVPANSYRAMLAMDFSGRVGSVTNTTGAPVFRNLLDDGSGNASIAGNIAANNLPAIKGAQTFTDSRAGARGSLDVGNFTVLDTVSSTAPANGTFLIYATATVEIDSTAVVNGKCSMELKLDDNTPGQNGQLTNTRFTCRSGEFDGSGLSIVWSRPVSASVTYTFQTSTYLYRDYGSGSATGRYWSSSLHVVFIPNSLP